MEEESQNDDEILAAHEAEFKFAETLRPRDLDSFIGQSLIKKQLGVVVDAAKERMEPPEHILLSGPPGLGKTTLSEVVANELGSWFHATAGSALSNANDLVAFFRQITPGAVVYIDEIHRVPKRLHEVFYPVMEDFRMELPTKGHDENASFRVNLPRFTLVGATTRPALLSGPFLSRFGVQLRLNYYAADEMQEIITRSAKLLGMDIDKKAIVEIANRSRSTPRTANQLLRRVRDYSMLNNSGKVDLKSTQAALDLFGIDSAGLDDRDRLILRTMIEMFGGRPVGLDTIAAAIGEEPDSLSDLVEPYLLRRGFILRTKKGRGVTDRAFQHLGVKVPDWAYSARSYTEDVEEGE